MPRSMRAGASVFAVAVLCAIGAPTARRSAAQPAPPPPAAAARSATGGGALGVHVVAPVRVYSNSVMAVRAAAHLATSETDWRPLPGAVIRATLSGAAVIATAEASTGPSGDADLRLHVPADAPGSCRLAVETRAPQGTDRYEGRVEVVTGGRLLVTTDKPLYQPGQTIHYRVLALRPFDLKPVAGRTVTFEVQDPRGNLLVQQEAALSRFGVAAHELPLAREVGTGTYRVRATLAATGGLPAITDERTVKVARYTPPKFQVTITPDHPFERPGVAATGVVAARYFFGKPVAGGRLTLDGGAHAVQAALGPDGTYRFTVPVTREFPLTLSARVRDGAAREEVAARTLTVDASPFHVEAVAEAGDLVPGLENHVYVAVVAPDGAPIRGARVEGAGDPARTDDAGVAVVTLTVARGESWRKSLLLTVLAPDGARATHRANLGVARVWEPTPAVLVRPERVLVPRGVPLAAEVLSSLKDGMAYLEAVKDGQTLRTAAGRLVDGRARITLPLDDGVFGTVSLRGEVVDGTGRRGSHERLAYVERRRDLRVEVTPDKAVHAPGEQLTVRFRTVDGVTGAGTPAQIGVVMVDEAVLALAPVRTGMERVFFTLGRELETPPRSVRLVPHGYTTTRLVGETGREALRDRVLRLLLASARPPWASRAESDPWSRRRTEWERQARRLPGLVESFMVTHVAGVREGGRWRFRDDLFPAMEAAGTLPAAAARDPWNRPLTPAAVARVAWGFRYDDYARRAVVQKLRRAYASVAAKAGSLPRERVAGRPATQSPHVWTTDDARRLCTATDLIDPWGNEMRVQRGPRYLYAFSGEFLSRHVLTSAGPDGEFGTDDDVQPDGDEYRPPKKGQRVKSVRGGVLAVLSGRASGSVYGIGGLGLSGTGRGGGGAGIGTIGLGSFGTIGRGGGVVERVRESFPETMLWRPDLVTDASGAATLSATVADSITTWRLLAVATAEDGRLGVAELGVRVFQDFFVDVDLPDRLTQGDELAVPVAVYNYQKRPAHVALRLEEAPWFTRLSDAAQELDLAPGQVGVRYFRVRALAVGRHALTVHARGGALTDAVRKSTEVAPDGVAVETSHSERLGAAGSYAVTVPADAIAGASRLAVRVFPGAMSQTLDGLEGMIRMPSGCFEQTSSTTYPNALILDYLRRTGTASPALVRRAAEYLALGYQRLLSFEVRGGGFSWFGNAPANQVLTAYGLNEFHDMAKVRFVDPRLIERTTRWLLAHQRPDGGFDPDKENINDGAVDAMAGDRLRTTAYIALALARAGTRGPATRKAAHFVSANLAKARDPYTLALAADLFAALGDAEAGRTLARLWPLHERATRGVSFAPARATVFHGGGNAGRIETTALVAEALVTSRRDPARARQTLDFLIASKDALGSWHSTQATVLTLRALLAGLGGRARGDVTVDVDGARAGALVLGGADGDATRELDLTPFARPGAHRIDLKFRGQGEPLVHVVARAFRPRAAVAAGGAAPGDLRLSVEYDRTAVATAEAVTARVRLTTASRTPINMPVVEIGVPPGFGLDEDALEPLVRRGLIDKYERGPGKLVLYVSRLAAGAPLAFDVPLRPRMPLRVQAPASTVYEYYRPESRAEVVPVVLTVRGS